jgi:hypothetical protein
VLLLLLVVDWISWLSVDTGQMHARDAAPTAQKTWPPREAVVAHGARQQIRDAARAAGVDRRRLGQRRAVNYYGRGPGRQPGAVSRKTLPRLKASTQRKDQGAPLPCSPARSACLTARSAQFIQPAARLPPGLLLHDSDRLTPRPPPAAPAAVKIAPLADPQASWTVKPKPTTPPKRLILAGAADERE